MASTPILSGLLTRRATSDLAIDERSSDDALHVVTNSQRKGDEAVIKSTGSSIISAVVDAVKNINALDDRKMLLERITKLLSDKESLPDGLIRTKLEQKVVELFYDDVAHPPATSLGHQYSYRTADGSYNNISDPDMGKAGMPYARSVQGTRPLPRNMLPDAGLVFDTLLKRDGFVKHPAGLSSMMFSFAALVVHTVFRTSHQDVRINETSSYADLAPLYGNNQDAQDKVRVRDGRGLLFPDTFSEDRLLMLPPAVCALLVLFNRNHNYIARKLLEINERGTYVDPSSLYADDPKHAHLLLAQEEDIFQTARLINCGWFGSALFADYFASLSGLVREKTTWSLNPLGEIRDSDHKLFERGRGNVCSVEFNCLYRWHAATSREDEKWVESLTSRIFGDKPADELNVDDFRFAMKSIQASRPDVTQWTFGSLQRQANGTFKDSELAALIMNATENPAAAFRARGTPHVMRLHEILGIESNRRWGVCSLNEFRKFIGLKPYSSFEEWNSNTEIAIAAERLYGEIDNLELYVGLQAEEPKPVVPGAGLCAGYTLCRAILSDAVALTRGDRFFTTDFTPFNLTAWGFADCQRDVAGPGNGSILGKLFLRTLPGKFSANSVYTWFPLQTPESMKGYLGKLGVADQYDFARPIPSGDTAVVKDFRDVVQILRSRRFRAPYSRAARVVPDDGFFLAAADPMRGERDRQAVLGLLLDTSGGADRISQYFYEKTRALIASKSYTLTNKKIRNIDIVKDVLRCVPLHWAATELAGIQLTSEKRPSLGTYTEEQLYSMITDIYSFLFLDVDPSKMMNLEIRVTDHVRQLQRDIKSDLTISSSSGLSIAGLVGFVQQLYSGEMKDGRPSFAKPIIERKATLEEVSNSLLALMVGATVELSQSLTNIVNLYLDDENSRALFKHPDGNRARVDVCILEGLRIDPPFRGIYRESLVDQVVGQVSVRTGQRVLADLLRASQDPEAYPEAAEVDKNCTPKENYLIGDNVMRTLGEDLTMKIIRAVLRAVFELDGLRRGPGTSGSLKRYFSKTQSTLSTRS
ncbi:linoleate diol synthase [Artomyces pyxidatus]|uniref:Linoleate diol synthase n=1 Tax=Artomyces pyxidatus TaxID=48021 RepID=A0ACB8STG8_9AGAM|nr:linoleate diol synthase [Artomyces pyxidatus]